MAAGTAQDGQLDRDMDFLRVLRALDTESTGKLSGGHVLDALEEVGILEDDLRIKDGFKELRKLGAFHKMHDIEAVAHALKVNSVLITRALTGELTVPSWKEFCAELQSIFEQTTGNVGGNVATYIPALAKVNPDQYAVSVCTVDGQRFSIGDHNELFGVQSCSKPISYCMALKEHGEQVVHSQVGREASGRGFNEMCLKEIPEGKRVFPDRHAIPHNPMINAGAIMSCSMIQPGCPLGDRLEHCMKTWTQLCGSDVSFSGSMFLGERETADRNFCLGYMMKEANAFGPGANLQNDLELYFQTCSILCNAEQMAQLGATFANGGTNPITGEVVFDSHITQMCLSLMLSCGMYDFSGEWAFTIGLPAKSGVGGCVFVVVPNFGGFAIWSPRLDEMGNSVRGVGFATELVKRFAFHHYDNLAGSCQKLDPRRAHHATKQETLMALLFAAADGDMRQLVSLLAGGANPCSADYDGRTAMHLAASEGHTECVTYLLAHGAPHSPRDRWNGTPLGDAVRHGHAEVVSVLRAANAEE